MECMKWLRGILGVIPSYLWPGRERDTAKKRWVRIVATIECSRRFRKATMLSRLQGDRSRDVELLPVSVNQSPDIAPASVELVQSLIQSPIIAANEPVPVSESSDASVFPIPPDWLLSIANFLLEVLSEVFNQLSSKRRPNLGLVSMLMSFATLLVCLIELIHRGCKEKVAWKKKGMIYWFFHPNDLDSPFGTLNDVIAFTCSMLQCVFASIAYSFYIKHIDDPIKLSHWPIIFASGLFFSKIYQHKSKSGTVTEPGPGLGQGNPQG